MSKAMLGVGLVLLVLSFSSCKSVKQATSTVQTEAKTEQNILGVVSQNAPVVNALSSKMKLTVNTKGKEISLNGTLRMKKDEVIQLSIVPFLGIEVGRIEISPTKVLILDRVNKQYVEEPISELSDMINTEMDFYTLQALFTNAMFVPGTKELSKKEFSEFTMKQVSDTDRISAKREIKDYRYSFTLIPTTGQLVESEVSSVKSDYKLTWKYNDFQPLGTKNFPSQMDIMFGGGAKSVNAQIALQRLTENGDWESVTSVSSKYKKMSLEELFKVLLGL